MIRQAFVLIVEDDRALASSLALALQARAQRVCTAASLAEARGKLHPAPALVLLDFSLPDGTAEDLLVDLAALQPLPALIAMSGTASSDEAFRIAQAGVNAFLSKPFDLAALDSAWDRALHEAPDPSLWARRAVGRLPLRVVEDSVRQSMVGEALARTSGSRKGAARLLEVSRQLLQHVLKK